MESLFQVVVKDKKLSKLILFLREGRSQKLSQQELADTLKLRQKKSIQDWENGKLPSAENQERIAAYLGKSLSDLRAYMGGEVTLEEFMQGVSEVPRSRQFQQILEWLPLLQPGEVMEIGQGCFDLLNKHFYPTETASNSTEMDAGDLKLFLTQLAGGHLPTNGQLVALAHDLDVPTEILMELRDRIRTGNDTKKEQTSGA